MPLSFTVSDSLILYKSIIRVSFAFSNRLFHLSLLTRIAFDSENVVFDSDIEDIKGMITYDIFVLINLIFINQILGIPDMVNFVTERLDGISQAPHVRSKALISFFVPGCDFLARPRLDIPLLITSSSAVSDVVAGVTTDVDSLAYVGDNILLAGSFGLQVRTLYDHVYRMATGVA